MFHNRLCWSLECQRHKFICMCCSSYYQINANLESYFSQTRVLIVIHLSCTCYLVINNCWVNTITVSWFRIFSFIHIYTQHTTQTDVYTGINTLNYDVTFNALPAFCRPKKRDSSFIKTNKFLSVMKIPRCSAPVKRLMQHVLCVIR